MPPDVSSGPIFHAYAASSRRQRLTEATTVIAKTKTGVNNYVVDETNVSGNLIGKVEEAVLAR